MQIHRKIDVPTKERDYQVLVGRDLLESLLGIAQEAYKKSGASQFDKVFFISDSNVWKIYEKKVTSSFNAANVEFGSFVFPAGEKSKNPSVLFACVEKMAKVHLTRDSLVVAVGGGVACDLGGFAAATYMRGVSVLQVPTSLLAMVDASVGGKTAVDLKNGKNMFGAFHQPIAVVADVDVLKTLEDAQFNDAIGEIIKHAILADKMMFEVLGSEKLTKDSIETGKIDDLVAANIAIKRDIVVEDEKEKGLRQTLNLGHTIGHAIEAASNYEISHGNCVAAGISILVSGLAKTGRLKQNIAEKIVSTIKFQGLMTETNFSTKQLLELIASDKKRHSDYVNVVIVKDICDCCVEKMTLEEISQFL